MTVFHLSPHYANFDVGHGYWLSLSEQQRSALFLERVREALFILANHHFDLPDGLSVESVVEASFKAFQLYVLNGTEQADPDHWHGFFEKFVVTCYLQAVGLESNPRVPGQILLAEYSEERYAASN